MSQNKELKANLTELQDAFVRMTQQNMELASDLETERHRSKELSRAREGSPDSEECVKSPEKVSENTGEIIGSEQENQLLLVCQWPSLV